MRSHLIGDEHFYGFLRHIKDLCRLWRSTEVFRFKARHILSWLLLVLLMLLLFAGGIMNLFWVAGLAMFVLFEKVFARGDWFSRLAGGGLIISGLIMPGVDYL